MGVPAETIEVEMRALDFASLVDDSALHMARSLVPSFGLHPSARIAALFRPLIAKYAGRSDARLGDVQAMHGIELVIVTTRLNDNTTLLLSSATHADWPVARCLHASMALPPVFTPFRMGEDLLVDGGLRANTPIALLPARPHSSSSRSSPLTLTLSGATEHEWHAAPVSVAGYIDRLAFVAYENLGKTALSGATTVEIPTGDVQTTDMALSLEVRDTLIAAGYEATKSFLQRVGLWSAVETLAEATTLTAAAAGGTVPRAAMSDFEAAAGWFVW
jgi:predicted acylesterase/phospholipase RssA